MSTRHESRRWRNGTFVGTAFGVGSGLGVAAAALTQDWRWYGVILGTCLGAAVVVAWRVRRQNLVKSKNVGSVGSRS